MVTGEGLLRHSSANAFCSFSHSSESAPYDGLFCPKNGEQLRLHRVGGLLASRATRRVAFPSTGIGPAS